MVLGTGSASTVCRDQDSCQSLGEKRKLGTFLGRGSICKDFVTGKCVIPSGSGERLPLEGRVAAAGAEGTLACVSSIPEMRFKLTVLCNLEASMPLQRAVVSIG